MPVESDLVSVKEVVFVKCGVGYKQMCNTALLGKILERNLCNPIMPMYEV